MNHRRRGLFRHQQAVQPQRGKQPPQQRRHHADSPIFHQQTRANRRADEPHRPPEPNLAVTMDLLTQMIEGDRLELRQGRIPEKAEQQHHQRQSDIGIANRIDSGKRQQRRQTGAAHHPHSPTTAVGQPSPQIGRYHLGGLRDCHQLADPGWIETQRQQIQPPIRQQHAQNGEIKQIETG